MVIFSLFVKIFVHFQREGSRREGPPLAPQSETHSDLAFALVRHHTHSVAFLKPTVSSRPSVLSIASRKCLRFGIWLTLCIERILLTYLNTTLPGMQNSCTGMLLTPLLLLN